MVIDSLLVSLALLAFATSAIAGLFGFAGGMMLVAALPHFLPAAAIIPVHTAVQVFSNSSRAVFGWQSIHWGFVREHLLGSLIGIALAYTLFANLNLSYLPAIIGIYILLHTWSQTISKLLSRFESFYILGGLQTGVALLVGAPGPIPLPLLIKKLADHHKVVCTMAMFMTSGHLLKMGVFVWADFNFLEYWVEILIMIITAVLGSYIGTRLRHRFSSEQYLWVAKLLLTILAVAAILKAPFIGLI